VNSICESAGTVIDFIVEQPDIIIDAAAKVENEGINDLPYPF
jgi:hypothetical protein